MDLTKEEARALNHNYMGTEHLLLGILREGSAPGVVELSKHGITLENMRGGVKFILGRMTANMPNYPPQTTPGATAEEPGFTPRTAQVLAMAGDERQRQGEAAISPHHLLVAILREGQGIAAMLLQVSGVRWQQVGQTVEISFIADDESKPLAVPADLQAALEQHPDERALFERLASFKKQPLIDQVERAEGEAVRKQAIERVIQLLQQARQNYQQPRQ